MKFSRDKLAQVWIETVIYTLIALVLMGTVIAFAKPKIEQMQDKAIIEQSLEIMSSIDQQIISVVQGGQGNKRVMDVMLKKGSIVINPAEDKISFQIESKAMYSEPEKEVQIGDIIAFTTKKGKVYDVSLTRKYEDYDITYKNGIDTKTITKSPTPYKIIIYNGGKPETTVGNTLRVNVDIDIG